jgi:hypothetical protein
MLSLPKTTLDFLHTSTPGATSSIEATDPGRRGIARLNQASKTDAVGIFAQEASTLPLKTRLNADAVLSTLVLSTLVLSTLGVIDVVSDRHGLSARNGTPLDGMRRLPRKVTVHDIIPFTDPPGFCRRARPPV